MKKHLKFLITLAFLLLAMPFLSAQEFSFPIYFEDSAGNQDTLVLGFDTDATSSIDGQFGEENIIGQSWDEEFEVRATDQWLQPLDGESVTFHTKKQIVDHLSSDNNVIGVDINTDNWPVKASWDETLFAETIEFSVFTSIFPGGWWDTSSPSNLGRKFLSQDGNATFSSNESENGCTSSFYCYTSNENMVSYFWVAFGDFNFTNTRNITKGHPFTLFPNPASSQVRILSSTEQHTVASIRLLSQSGQVLTEVDDKPELNLISLPAGLYLVEITLHDGQRIIKRLVKIY